MGFGPRVFLGLILGGISGVLAWVSTDFFFNRPGHPDPPAGLLNVLLGSIVGLFIGAALGMADALANASRARMGRYLVRGALSGFLGGAIGMYIGSLVFNMAGGRIDLLKDATLLAFISQVLIRALGWTVLGSFLGGVYGLLDTGTLKGRNGAIGGAIGGFLGGIMFNPLAYALVNDRISRLVGWVLLGAFIGFFTALVNLLLKTAWVFVIYGRNEGREIILEKGISRIGRHELAEIPLFRDRLIAANHAEIRLENGRYTLVDGGSVVGTSVNGQKVTQPVLLKDSDLIQVGNTQVVFYERATAGPVRRQIDLSKASPAAPPLAPEGTCPFCGQRKDPATGACACSTGVGAAAAPGGTYSNSAAPPSTYSNPAGTYPNSAAPGSVPGAGFSPAGPSVGGAFNPPAAFASPGPTRLVAVSGPHAGETFALGAPQVTVGRDPGSTLPLARDTTVSRRHASLSQNGSEWVVTDLGSSNGTFINGARITSGAIRPGDEVMFGTARFRVE